MMKYENPSIDEIEKWAYSEAEWPDVDWPLFLSWKEDIKTWLKLATDHKCPKRDFFRYMLYYQVGKAFQGSFGKNTEFIIKSYLQDAKLIKHGDIRKWIADVKQLLNTPKIFNYSDWCEGKLARYNFTYRDREKPHSSPLPHHAAYGSVLRDSADQASSDPGERKSK